VFTLLNAKGPVQYLGIMENCGFNTFSAVWFVGVETAIFVKIFSE
jgi:hypothetical protein